MALPQINSHRFTQKLLLYEEILFLLSFPIKTQPLLNLLHKLTFKPQVEHMLCSQYLIFVLYIIKLRKAFGCAGGASAVR